MRRGQRLTNGKGTKVDNGEEGQMLTDGERGQRLTCGETCVNGRSLFIPRAVSTHCFHVSGSFISPSKVLLSARP